jgi:hypothetical protein
MENDAHLNFGECLHLVTNEQRGLLRQLEKKEKLLLNKVSSGHYNEINMNGVLMGDVNEFKYLGSVLSKDGLCKARDRDR